MTKSLVFPIVHIRTLFLAVFVAVSLYICIPTPAQALTNCAVGVNCCPTTTMTEEKLQSMLALLRSFDVEQAVIDAIEKIFRDEMECATCSNNCESSITVTVPNGGEQWEVGMMSTITWTPYNPNSNINHSRDVKAYLEKKMGSDFNSVYEIIPSGKASIHWDGEVKDMVTGETTYPAPGEYYMHVINNKTWVGDWSDKPFRILPRAIDIKVNGSDGPVTLYNNQPITVTFKQETELENCTLSGVRRIPNGGYEFDISSTDTINGYAFVPTDGGSPAIVVRCETGKGEQRSDAVQVNAESVPASIKVVSPNGGEQIKIGDPYNIAWKQTGLRNVSIALYSNDQWKQWIVKDFQTQFANDSYIYQWTPAQTDVGMSRFKIYITGQKADETGYVDDTSDAPFSFVGTATSTLIITADKISIPRGGGDATLRWRGTNLLPGTSNPCALYYGYNSSAFSLVKKGLGYNGTSPAGLTYAIEGDYHYKVVCDSPTGQIESKVTITITKPLSASIVITADKISKIKGSADTTLRWKGINLTYNSCALAYSYNGGTFSTAPSNTLPFEGSTPAGLGVSATEGTYTYKITCQSSLGPRESQVTITITPPEVSMDTGRELGSLLAAAALAPFEALVNILSEVFYRAGIR